VGESLIVNLEGVGIHSVQETSFNDDCPCFEGNAIQVSSDFIVYDLMEMVLVEALTDRRKLVEVERVVLGELVLESHRIEFSECRLLFGEVLVYHNLI
jgi:hypothetical protein